MILTALCYQNPTLGDWAAVAGAIVGGVGAAFIFWQILEVQKALKAQTLSELYDQYFEICRLLADKPFLRPFFYDNLRFKEGPSQPAQRSEIDAVCELITGLLEHASVQRKNIPSQTWERCWLPFLEHMYDHSAELELFFVSNKHFYTAEFCEQVSEYLKDPRHRAASESVKEAKPLAP
jgi:hypothetical protein